MSPAITTIGIESSAALATPVDAFVSPGPRCDSTTAVVLLGARIAVGHVRGDLLVARVDELDLLLTSAASTAMLVWPHRPNMYSTPRSSRYLTSWCEMRSLVGESLTL